MSSRGLLVRSLRLSIPLIAVAALCACQQARQFRDEVNAAGKAPKVLPPDPSRDVAYVCPMDTDVRSAAPGKCSRCGMLLVAGIPDPSEFHLDLTVTPSPLHVNERAQMTFDVFDPWKDRRVEKFSIVHEKPFHAFIVSRDLQFFVHDHPTWKDGAFHYSISLPKPGMYRVLGDFYPEAATPQMLPKTIFVAGQEGPVPPLTPDYSEKQADNLKVGFTTSPAEPEAGAPTQMRVTINPGDGFERYLGAWGHMLAASDDLVDMIHAHPFIADGGPEMQFNLVFPRPRMYRIWVQVQRKGVVNTAHFDVRAKPAPPTPAN